VSELLTILVLFGLPLVLVVALHVTRHRSTRGISWKPWNAEHDELKVTETHLLDPSDPVSRAEHGLSANFRDLTH
jgi:hypothetical protein